MVYPTLISHIAVCVTIKGIIYTFVITCLHHIQHQAIKEMSINAHELLPLYLSRYEAATLCQTNDVCIWMHMNSCLHTQQGTKLHRYAQ